MPQTRTPIFIYASVLEPWTRLALNSPAVISLRLSILPWLWVTDPVRASRETQQMFSEKQAAVNETGLVMSYAPMRFWFDTMASCFSRNPQTAFARAMINSSRRAARPSNSRVQANQKRLSSTVRGK